MLKKMAQTVLKRLCRLENWECEITTHINEPIKSLNAKRIKQVLIFHIFIEYYVRVILIDAMLFLNFSYEIIKSTRDGHRALSIPQLRRIPIIKRTGTSFEFTCMCATFNEKENKSSWREQFMTNQSLDFVISNLKSMRSNKTTKWLMVNKSRFQIPNSHLLIELANVRRTRDASPNFGNQEANLTS